MPSLDTRANEPLVKLMLIGESGTGKTGSLVSLVKAGYALRVLDLDNGLDALVNQIKLECPEKLSSVSYMSFRDRMKFGPTGSAVEGTDRAYRRAMAALEKWEDGSDPSKWGSKTILVVDSLTNLGTAAFKWVKQMNPTVREPRQWYNQAQQLLTDFLENVTSEAMQTNVIIISHVQLQEMPDGTTRGFATSIGKALGPQIPRFFNTLVALEIKGQGSSVKRTLRTVPTSLLTLKNPAPQKVPPELDIADGMAKLFAFLSNPAT